jgi:hypothetical protein
MQSNGKRIDPCPSTTIIFHSSKVATYHRMHQLRMDIIDVLKKGNIAMSPSSHLLDGIYVDICPPEFLQLLSQIREEKIDQWLNGESAN